MKSAIVFVNSMALFCIVGGLPSSVSALAYYTPTISPTITSTFTTTPTATPTMSSTASISPTFSVTPIGAVSLTPNGTQTVQALSATQTPASSQLQSGTDITILGPVPAKSGQDLCLYFKNNAEGSEIELFNLAGERISRLSFNGGNACMQTTGWAPGVYLAHFRGAKSDGWQKVVIVP